MALYIYGVTVDFSKSKTNIESAEVRIGELHSLIEYKAGKSLRHAFSSPIVLPHGQSFSLRIRHKRHFLKIKHRHEDITFNPDEMFRAYNASQQEYTKVHNDITIVVKLSSDTTTEQAEQSVSPDQNLQPTTFEIFQRCPRFRILVIGKAGVGKSSLISQAFGVEKDMVAHDRPGQADIDQELISPRNKRFVLHDSKGFEPGDEDNFKIVRDFIDRRRNMTQEHQLHAVWLCFEIPRAGGRLLEVGVEKFLESQDSGTLKNVPVIVVLTKYDMLIERMERTLGGSSLSDEAHKARAKEKAEAWLQDTCIGPLEQFAELDIPNAKISTEEGYEETLTHLIHITENRVSQHPASEASATTSTAQHSAPEAAVMTSIAQRLDPGLKIKASIEVGKKRYWKALASCPTFKNRKMWDCLYVLHTDIVNVWNFHDPHDYLHSLEFRKLMTTMVDNIQVGPTTDPTDVKFSLSTVSAISIVGAIAGIVSALAAPAAPIVVPIAVGAVLAAWVWELYQTSHLALQRFMAYIIHLTLVLQTLFIVLEGQQITRRAIKRVVDSYRTSEMSGRVLTWIQDYDKQLNILERADREILTKITEVMRKCEIDGAQLSELREKVPRVDLSSDESW
ncbi:uncharacterized protein F5891DRAFT_442436 [Suillus fuscotomentosus]|uniref:G domain-containing protein n=1 Tax=Suillus fuscotomentosus TaxID=1912939 RepID=A0AAD4HJH5_9AGAM|nr:uncharacterized protein F5891DRAFT_442436 [Suillus fuscotomentosus]KAG1898888.1 hypothetical protein F5891DRAFT_442436 [Suillus fuscotomentosus]